MTDNKPPTVTIGGRPIGHGHPPFVIAEMSGNHNNDLTRALEIVDSAASAGAHAVKIQTYNADTMTIDCDSEDFQIRDPASLWSGKKLYDLYVEAHTPWEWHEKIFKRCHDKGIICFSTPFDETSVDFLELLGAPCYKVASFENTDLPLIRKIAATGKPMIISTGMATLEELTETVETARAAGCRDLILLKCTSAYPASFLDANLLTIPKLKDVFHCEVGLSDHTMGTAIPVAAVALGASVIEKHFTLRRADGGIDSAFSLEPAELRNLVADTLATWESLGEPRFGPAPGEHASLKFRRSLYVVKDMKAGDVITTENVRRIRPGFGLAPKHLESVMGKRINKDVRRGTPLQWNLIEEE